MNTKLVTTTDTYTVKQECQEKKIHTPTQKTKLSKDINLARVRNAVAVDAAVDVADVGAEKVCRARVFIAVEEA